ncbi:hypothetical protein TRFO_11639 [Tritrichomonas foetus]|uniref:Uncharacterized protein n=1 Tax=Tritrichomonas foetus TaxID=1144522 RepID=A0A1J4J8U1_9EUKA|nr:hypothetical protein TRFO_11639 [Tritrichomonas foetus]|eukprot:OHS93644.1 hypothetical protein TRFO_11639 [Tritrichomonas foetus]
MGENEDGVMTPITSIKISQPEIEEQEESENEQKAERVNNKYTVSLASPDTEAFEDLLSFETKQDVDQMFYASGKFADGNIYSLVTLSTHEAELTVYDPSAKTVTLYRLQKPVPVQQTSMMQMLMPMLPMLIMQFMGRPNFAPPQQQGGEGGGEGGAAPAGGAN